MDAFHSESDAGLFQSTLSIDTKLDRARLQLLDLSARNRLLNIPRSRTRGANLIEVVDERACEVYRLLVRESRALTFVPGRLSATATDNAEHEDAEEIFDLAQPEDSGIDSRGIANRHSDHFLQTRLTSKGLQNRLLTLFFDARTLEEEQGVNVLYLALGTLKWIDPNNAANIRYAPLVLVPVALERATAGDRFKLRWRQEDPSSNLSLEAMVDRLHLLKLPAFEATDDFDVDVYSAAVAAAVASKAGWEVAPDDIVLGFFSFSKFLMYRDLSPETWPASSPLAAQPLIRALLREGFPAQPPSLPDDAPIDPMLPPSALLHIVDSDSSQTLAVHDARLGRNLVIQGPPGTGKSQTIANIIAAAIADGRTVLFVAEKMAALDVVKRRLDAAGVGDACVELHSNKANKRLLLDELRRTWELGSPRGAFATSLTERLTAARDELNAHVERLHRMHPVAGLSPFDVIGQLARLRNEGQRPNELSLPTAIQWSPDGLSERRGLLVELSERVQLIGQPSQHPWRGVELESILPNQLVRLVDRIGSLRDGLQSLDEQFTALAQQLKQPVPDDFAAFMALRTLAQRVATAPGLDSVALGDTVWNDQRAAIDALIGTGNKLRGLTSALASAVQPQGFSVAVEATLATLSLLPNTFGPEAFACCRKLAERIPPFLIEVTKLKNQLGLDDTLDTLAAVSRAAATGQRVASAPDASPEVFAAAIWDTGVEQAAELAEAVATLEDARRKVGEQVLASAWDTDTATQRHLMRLKGGSILRFFSGDWRRANALLRSLVRDPKQPAGQLLGLLDEVSAAQSALQHVRAGDAMGRAAFGVDWNADRSKSTPLRALVAWMRSLRGLGAAPRLIAARLPDRTDIGSRATRVQHLIGELRPMLETFWADLGTTTAAHDLEEASVGAARLSTLLARVNAIAAADEVALKVLRQAGGDAGQRRELLVQVRQAQLCNRDLIAQEVVGRAALGSWWKRVASDWTACTAAALWIDRNRDIRELAAGLPDRGAPAAIADLLQPSVERWREEFDALLSELCTSAPRLFASPSIDTTSLTEMLARLSLWIEHSEQLSKWTAYRNRARRASELGLAEVSSSLAEGGLQASQVVPAFEMAYFEALLNDMVQTDPELGRFDGELHQRTVSQFAELDRESLRANRLQVVQAHHRRLPPRDGGFGPLAVLRGEMAKKKSLLPIRQLMQKAAPAIQALKPVLMMSPLSIAQFLPAGQLSFDLLVMDEASQIQPVDALGAIARCRQVVVVGDEQQLPPTRFFSKVVDGDGSDEADDGAQVGDIESILGLFSARGLQQRMLRWHYRSRHQSLIAVSNSQFYENKLIIVPSPYTAQAGMGLSFHHLPDGVFDSGGSGANALEAATVARAIIVHARTHPEQSLGVATFSVRQRRAILDQLELLRRQCPDTEAFFQAHFSEPFFVKNLENVQGDERDVIFISVGYGRNAQGVMAMRFGPLGNDGGERRLNVLISRAKLRCAVYASITDDDIDLDRARGKGVVAFKLFLRFARTGRLDLAGAEAAGVADAFESQVASALQSQGYQVHPRVGIAGLFIDLAVADPQMPGRYIMGIECDGRSYRDARSARDRDRLRRAVLEDHGWTLHRIWSVDWFHRPQEQLACLIAAIEAAKRELASATPQAVRLRRAVPVEVVIVERDEVSEIGLAAGPDTRTSIAYQEARIRALPGYGDIPSAPAHALATLVEEIVAIEGPVHLDIVVLRIREAWGALRAGSRIQAAIEDAISLSVRAQRLQRQHGSFLQTPKLKSQVRDRSTATAALRKPEMVSPDEIRAAVLQVIHHNLGVRHEEVAPAVVRLLGFAATTAAWRELVATQVNEALRLGSVQSEADLLVALQPR